MRHLRELQFICSFVLCTSVGEVAIPLLEKIRREFQSHFGNLITEGEKISRSIKIIPGELVYSSRSINPLTSEISPKPYKKSDSHEIDRQQFVIWKTRVASFLQQLLDSSSVHVDQIDRFKNLECTVKNLSDGISVLKALQADFADGFLTDISARIEAELSTDYLEQASKLLAEEPTGNFGFIPAAVLAGAVLEKTLRSVCLSAQPPISIVNPRGEPLMMNGLIDALKKGGVFNELKAKQLRVFAGIRNAAAHGEFSSFTRSEVEGMLKGIHDFLATIV